VKTLGLFDPDYPVVDIRKVPGFRYRGGKYKLRRYICRFAPTKGNMFGEPFAGRANVFFLMKCYASFKSWWLNDIRTLPFFMSIQHYDGHKLSWPTEEGYHSRRIAGDNTLTFMEPALFWDGMTSTKANGKTPTFCPRLENGKMYNLRLFRRTILRAQRILASGGVNYATCDAVEFIKLWGKDPDNFLYIDPPYLGADVDAYHEGMVDREGMLRAMKECKCRWLFSEYDVPDMREMFGPPGAKIRKVRIEVPAAGGGNKKVKRLNTECLWANYPLKPMPFGFGNFDPPMRQSIRILESHFGVPLSRKLWRKTVPSSWPVELADQEFKKLQHDPYVYFDGRFLHALEGRK
jgi:hypothetical protein